MVAMDHIKQLKHNARVKVYVQTFMVQDIGSERMHDGNTLTSDVFQAEKFDFIITNPLHGMNWKVYAQSIMRLLCSV
ncbi:hypothetical protein E5345_04035 [Propionibacterium sp. NM47_B9-13]|jgi:type I restriction-modification system DNA methylase subunit|uniref:Uncharacterized protein n=3 Tax=Cutibacterium modestum TaxID=2559073 RepID=A0AAD1KNG8_9ACTN|nr:hypothetical protein BCB70_02805 [Cutibacterium modestum]EFS75397.1 hypothetical protein HMPREF9621_00241 [Cutibacterium modestum HL037PA2]EFS91267.1 hypothetical protein HMPREF9607_02558 [Cutibacterium modestum HL044PA1]EFT16719.1 hypothetical protein HMPREF9622_00263 [Cutibacterium modestum HL037PA3]MCP2378169.1 type I restriction-modification system methyltransferase subunit [Cutibacterium modestum 31N]MCP2381306.1 type I restriction-modification system methyltransferase subunit [Cutibac